jgi:hypothetical protein
MDGLQELYDISQIIFPAAFEEAIETIPVTETLQHHFAGMVVLIASL